MKQQKAQPQTKKVLWRITEAAPKGEFVDVDLTAAAPGNAPQTTVPPRRDIPEVTHGSWLESSYELLSGAEVNDGPDTVPDDLFDQLFPQPQAERKVADK